VTPIRLAELDAHEGPVYVAEEDALARAASEAQQAAVPA
jgi:hypothetical protein